MLQKISLYEVNSHLSERFVDVGLILSIFDDYMRQASQ